MKLIIVNCGHPRERAAIKYQPLAPAYLAAYTPAHWKIELVDENFELFSPNSCSADLVAFSALPRFIDHAYGYSKILRDRGVATVGGGLHVSAMPEEAAENFDSIVEGDAEPVWPGLLDDFEAGRLRRHYVAGFDRELDGLKLPDRGFIHPGYKIASLSTSRGCRNSCSFCYMGSLKKKAYRLLPVGTIVEDFKRVSQKKVVLADTNFLGFTPEHVEARMELCRELIRNRVRKYWGAQITADIVGHPDLLKLMHEAGCRSLFIGFESVGEESLRFIHKDQNVPLDYARVVRTVQDAEIAVTASLILGLDTHTRGYERELIDWLDKAQPLFLNLGILAPMPNTHLYKKFKAERRLLYDGVELWKLMDKATNTIRYKNLSGVEVAQMFERVTRHYYRTGRVLKTFLYHFFVKRKFQMSCLYLVAARRKRRERCHWGGAAATTDPSTASQPVMDCMASAPRR